MFDKMSVLPGSATLMTQATRNGQQDTADAFHKFFDCWISEQNQYLQQLVFASEDYEQRRKQQNDQPQVHNNGHRDNEEVVLSQLVNQVVQHYEQYYRAKSSSANRDVLAMLSPSWLTTFEDAFLWIGGWRPSMAFHLLYSKSGLQLEAQLAELIRGISTGDLGDLSPNQFTRVDELQQRTINEEKEITEEMAQHQETVADSAMIDLSHVVSEMIRNNEVNREENAVDHSDQIESVLKPKEEGLLEILHKADDLRLRTLKGVLNILTPIQSVHFLIAAAELHLRIHDWGKKKDGVTHQSAC